METVLSGIQPTGKLHLGNYIGAVKNWVKIQEEYRCFYMIADLHSLTTHSGKAEEINDNVMDIYMDLLACGIDVKKSVLFIQSAVPAHTQLHLILSMITPLGWLERNPTFKEKKTELTNTDLNNYGFLGYPVLQAADILLYKASKVPVGMDQIPHLEITREITRKFNSIFKDYFPEPTPLLTEVPKIAGIDGRKMSKSYDNAIYLSDTPEVLEKKLKKFITDPAKVYKDDPGDPEKCTVYPFYKIFINEAKKKETAKGCKDGTRPCVQCKKEIADTINHELIGYRDKKEKYKKNMDFINKTIIDNNKKANEVAIKHIKEIYRLTGMDYEW
ncbi:MAG: tryptophan--tRNA ligase [Spirochaetes bacterium]|nr:tryptophan--tRNA ligase [Spirochaetota bacterium]